MTFLDYLPCLQAGALIAIVLIAAVLFVRYLRRSERDRLENWRAKWRAIGLTPQTGTREALRQRTLAGEYRGRNLTMSYASPTSPWHPDRNAVFTRVRTAVRSPLGGCLTITPKLPQVWPWMFGLERWLSRLGVPKTHEIEDHFSIRSHPPDLAAWLLALPRTSAILFSDPKPTIELEAGELRFHRPCDFPDPQDALVLFDIVCDLAELIEEASSSAGAG